MRLQETRTEMPDNLVSGRTSTAVFTGTPAAMTARERQVSKIVSAAIIACVADYCSTFGPGKPKPAHFAHTEPTGGETRQTAVFLTNRISRCRERPEEIQ